MKIIFFTGSMARGGAERVISILSGHYIKKGWDVCIGMLLHDFVEYKLDNKIKVVSLSSGGNLSFCGKAKLIKRVRVYITEENPDVIVSFMGQINAVVGFAHIGCKSRLITSERIDPSMVNRNIILKTILNIVYSSCDRVIMQTRRAKEYFGTRVQKNSIILPNPISVAQYASTVKKNKIVTVGRLTKQKNQQMLISAFAEIHKKYPEYTLDIYGEGPLEEELQIKINLLGISQYAFLHGNVVDIHCQIADAKIFVLPSNYEGMSNALLEAMMMGLTCIATNCAGSEEIIDDYKNGRLITVGDENGLYLALAELCSNEALSMDIGNRAKESTKVYAVKNTIIQWENVLEGKE